MLRSLPLAVFVGLLGFALEVSAAHDGFYLRGQLGIGGASARTDVAGIDIAYEGGSGGLNLEIGGSLNAQWVLFAKLYGLSIPNLRYDIEGFEGDTDTGGFIRGLGVGAQHFFPSNFYLGVALTASTIGTNEEGDQFYDSDPGPMLHFTLGREWWTSEDLALGVGGELAWGGFPDDQIDDEGFVWGGGFALVYFSVTLN